MPLRSAILSGNARLEQVLNGAPSVKRRPPDDDPDAVRRIQIALVNLGMGPMLKSFPNGHNNPPDGEYGDETVGKVKKFQQTVFPTAPAEWDGRVGKKTLQEMDNRLPRGTSPVNNPIMMSALAEKDKATSLRWAQAAVQSLGTARAFFASNNGPFNPALQPPPLRIALQALEAHFHFSTVVGSRVAAIDFISKSYGKAINILANSQNFFIDDTTTQEALNGTPAHVPFGKGKVNFTPAFRERTPTGDGFGPKCRAAMVLHEPIHITNHPLSSTVQTHVHEGDAQYAQNPARFQVNNAHSYACFAQHVFFGSDTRFGAGRPAE
jgi:peptidoglycan hydrolase-like protein with peptidoglycan-binding domain